MPTITHEALGSEGKVTGKLWKTAHTVVPVDYVVAKTLFFEVDGEEVGTGSTTILDATRIKVPFNHLIISYARLFAYLTTASNYSGRFFQLRHAGGLIAECDVTGQHAAPTLIVGPWTAFTSIVDLEIYLQRKTFDTSDMVLYSVGVEFR